jgi:hypothetical protein
MGGLALEWLRHRTFWALVATALAVGAFRVYVNATAEGRISPALRAAMEQASVFPRLQVELGFTPEDFHIKSLQKYGMIGGVQGSRIFLLQVSREAIRELSRIYWIQRIDLPSSLP